MHSTLTCLLLAAAGASGLQLAAAPSSLHRPQLVRHGAPCMQESPEPPPSQQLSDETLRKAAETASEPSAAWPTPEPQRAAINEPASYAAGGGVVPEESDEFDPRIILYVGVPALVLIGQLFFTFSRDAFVGTDNVGAANMDVNPPGLERLK